MIPIRDTAGGAQAPTFGASAPCWLIRDMPFTARVYGSSARAAFLKGSLRLFFGGELKVDIAPTYKGAKVTENLQKSSWAVRDAMNAS